MSKVVEKISDTTLIYPIYIWIENEQVRLVRMIEREAKSKEPNFKEVVRRCFADQADFNVFKLKEDFNHQNFVSFENKDRNQTVQDVHTYINNIIKEKGELKKWNVQKI